jgi:TfoX/Sxy family transcriptional regulator of competence genes
MAYNEHLGERIAQIFKARKVKFEKKKMMGGLCFMVDDKMCAGVVKDELMVRIDPGIYDWALKKRHCRHMDFTGRPMKGFLLVEPQGIDLDTDLESWIQLCLDYNPKAKSSKKK